MLQDVHISSVSTSAAEVISDAVVSRLLVATPTVSLTEGTILSMSQGGITASATASAIAASLSGTTLPVGIASVGSANLHAIDVLIVMVVATLAGVAGAWVMQWRR